MINGNIILKNKNFLYLNKTTEEQINNYKNELIIKFTGIDNFIKIIDYVKKLELDMSTHKTKYNQIIGFKKDSKEIINIEKLLYNHFGLFKEDFDRSYDNMNKWKKYILLKYNNYNICQIYLDDKKDNITSQGIIKNYVITFIYNHIKI